MLLLLLEQNGTGISLLPCTLHLPLCSSLRHVNMFPVQETHPLSQMNYLKHLRHLNVSCQMHKTSLTSNGSESDVP